MIDPERIPVIVGVGQVNDRPASPELGLDSGELMVAALQAAERDSGCKLLARLDMLAIVDQISFRALNPLVDRVAQALGASPRVAYQSHAPHGDTPILLLNEAANRIGAGEISIAAVTGGEALRTAAAQKKYARADLPVADPVREVSRRAEPSYLQSYGLVAPVDIYPLYENALRAANHQTLDVAQDESALIWSLFSRVAAANPAAWLREAVAPDMIKTSSPTNRPIAFPYNKLMVANSSVNQGAGFIVASLAEARRCGIDEARLVYVGMGASAKEPANILRRDRYDRSVSMETAITRALDLNGLVGGDIDHVELYSCFPCVPKLARRIVGWPADRPASVFGGLTFGGGPIANYMSHAVAAMVQRLRVGGETGFLFANGGVATDNHCIALCKTARPGTRFPQDFDCQAQADAARGPVPVIDRDWLGAARIETYTVFYDRAGLPKGGVVVARTESGARTLARVDPADEPLVALLTDGRNEPVGMTGVIASHEGTKQWRMT